MLRSNHFSGKLSCTVMSFSNPNGDWAPGSHGSVLNAPGKQWSMFPEDTTLIRSLFFTVWTQCLTENTNYYFLQQHMVFSVLWSKRQQVWGIIPLDTMIHHLASKALPVQEFPSCRVRMGSWRAGPVKSLQFPSFPVGNRDPTGSKSPGGMSSETETYTEDWYTVQLTPSPIATAFLDPSYYIPE